MHKNPEATLTSSISLASSVAIYLISSQTDQQTYTQNHAEPWIALSPEHSGALFGVQWWLHVTEKHYRFSILDCGTSAALAQEALNAGIGWVICHAPQPQITALLSHHAFNGRILTQRPPLSLPPLF